MDSFFHVGFRKSHLLLLVALSLSTRVAASAPLVLGAVDSATSLSDGVEVRSGAALIRIVALRDDIVRVRVAPDGVWPEDASWAVLPQPRAKSVTVTAESDPASVGFSTRALRVRLKRSPLALEIADREGHVLMADDSERPVEFHGAAFQVYKTMPLDEHYFGLGDKTGPFDRRNEAFTLWNTDAYRFQESTDPLYKSIPFVLGLRAGRAFGLLLDNTWRTNFDFGKESRGAYSFGAEGGPLDYYVLAGPDPKHVLESYAYLTGPTPLPPLWSLGFQLSRYSYYPESRVREIARRLRADRIPSDTIYLDIDYQLKDRPFTVDPDRFPHFQGMLSDLRRQLFHVIAITDLHIAALPNAGYAPYDTGVAGDHFVKNPDGSIYVATVWPGRSVFPDFTRKATREWWGGLYRNFVADGVAGFWNDMNEPAIFDVPTKTMPLDVVHRIEEPGWRTRTASHREIHNVMGMQNSRATYEGLLKIDPSRRPFVLTRATYAGGQRYAATWTGDNSSTWNHLRLSIPMLLNLGLSGFALSGDDLGGFAGAPPPDLMTKWLEIGMFNPIARAHTDQGTPDKEPWANGPEQEAVRRKYIEERYRLMPYLYTLAEETSRTGLPIMRPLFLEFPHATADGHPLDLDAGSEFLFGPSLLVAPPPFPGALETYHLFLPPGGWYNYWTGQKVDPSESPAAQARSGNPLTLRPAVDVLPLYVRAGTILPRQPLVQSTMESPVGPLELRVYPGPEGRGSLYLDDGVTMAYRRGEFLRLDFSTTQEAGVIRLNIGARQGSFAPWWKQIEVVIYGCPSPAPAITLDGRSLPATSYDPASHALHVLVPDDGRGSELLVK